MRVACDSAQLLLHTSDHCGESVTWHGEQRAVYWIDNRRNLVHRLIPDLRSLCIWKFEETVAALVLTEDPQVLCLVLGSRLLLWNPSTDERKEYGFPSGRPDGSAIDREGSLWNCRYGGGCIIRVSPSGEVQERVMFPTSNVTSCAFGGPNLTTLYVTTALSDASAATTDDGGLFAV